MNKFFVPVAYLGLIEGVSFAKDAAMKFSKTIATLPIQSHENRLLEDANRNFWIVEDTYLTDQTCQGII